jgi:predicted nucleic acid-binding protein
MSIWDALIWSVARLNGISWILTEDGQHNRLVEGVRYLNPFHPDFDLGLLEPQL